MKHRVTGVVRSLLGLAPLAIGAQVFAQSTATMIEQNRLEEVVVAAQKLQPIAGLITAEQATKSRSSVTTEYLDTQNAGQTVIQSLNLLPGVNFTNNDPYGSSGGNLRMRSFDGARISLMLDGIQLNDSGNYAVFTNQQIDSEIIEKATVNLGTTDVDSPTASATGGTINLITVKPKQEPALMGQLSAGSFDYRRVFAKVDSGAFGPWHTTAFLAASYQNYDKFKGPGELEKKQVNARIYQELSNGDFLSLAIHFNRNRNAFYRNISRADVARSGYDFDNDPTCTRLAPNGATVQNEGAAGVTCTNYYGIRINPSDTGNIRGQSSFTITDSLHFTFDPAFQYTLANGGGFTAVSETDGRLRGANNAAGIDLNGDGDRSDTIALYTPNTTNTRRYSVNTALIWLINDESTLRAGYTLDNARHRQTGQFGFMDANGNPENVFAGRDGRPVKTADGLDLRGRDRFSIARLDQFSVSFSSRALDGRLKYNVGVRAPYFKRDLNQYCYTVSTTGVQYCSSQTPSAPNPTTGFVTFAGSATAYVPPYTAVKKYDKLLPNAGVSFQPWDDANLFYTSYAQGFSAPRTDNLYQVQVLNVEPETTRSFDLGYRFQGTKFTTSTAVWVTKFSNRIASAFDPDLGYSVDRNVGDVDLWGVDSEAGVNLANGLSLYASASYAHSRVKGDVPFSVTPTPVFVPTAGKQLVETPEWTVGSRIQYIIGGFELGLQGKYVTKRWGTDVNDEYAPAYATLDVDMRYSLDMFKLKDSFLQFNITNILDRNYLGGVATSRFSSDTTKPYGNTVLYTVGAPRTFQVSLRVGI